MKFHAVVYRLFLLTLMVTIATPCFAEIIPASRKISWDPGIPGGIPVRSTIGANVQSYGAVGDGIADDTNAIRNAISACPENQVVYFPAGIYRITGSISINKSIVLRGAGQTSKIIFDSTSSTVIRFGTTDIDNTPVNLTGGYSKGSTSLTVQSAANFSVGDYILITQLDDTSLINQGDATWFKRSGRSMGQIVRITAINGNTLTINRGLYYNYSLTFDPEVELVVDPGEMLEYAGIENLYISRAQEDGMGTIIYMINCAYCWVKGVETNKVSGRHIQLQRCYGCVIRDSYVHHAFNYFSGANAYGISVSYYSSDCLVENNITYYLNVGIVLENTGGGNVISYNYCDCTRLASAIDWQIGDIGTHASHNYMDLLEGNQITHFIVDNVHGSSSHLTALRNYTDLIQPCDNVGSNITGFEIQANTLYTNIVGNVIGSPSITGIYELNGTTSCSVPSAFKIGYYGGGCSGGWDSRVSATMLRHGNFDYMTNSTHWDESISDHNIPASYYLDSEPSWWDDLGTNRPWPSIGPDIPGYVNDIPAKDRFYEVYGGGSEGDDTTIPSHPENLTIF